MNSGKVTWIIIIVIFVIIIGLLLVYFTMKPKQVEKIKKVKELPIYIEKPPQISDKKEIFNLARPQQMNQERIREERMNQERILEERSRTPRTPDPALLTTNSSVTIRSDRYIGKSKYNTTLVKLDMKNNKTRVTDLLGNFDKNIMKAAFYGKYIVFLTDEKDKNVYVYNEGKINKLEVNYHLLDIVILNGFLTGLTSNSDVIQFREVIMDNDEIKKLNGPRIFSNVDSINVSNSGRYFNYISNNEVNIFEIKDNGLIFLKSSQVNSDVIKVMLETPDKLILQTKDSLFYNGKKLKGRYGILIDKQILSFDEDYYRETYRFNNNLYHIIDKNYIDKII